MRKFVSLIWRKKKKKTQTLKKQNEEKKALRKNAYEKG